MYQQMITEKYTFRNKDNFIIKNNGEILQSYKDILNPKDNYAHYLDLTMKNFSNPQLRQIYFATAKVSLKKFHPFPAHYISQEYAEKLTKTKLKEIIAKIEQEIQEENHRRERRP